MTTEPNPAPVSQMEQSLCPSCRAGAPAEAGGCTCDEGDEICDDCELPLNICACEEMQDYARFEQAIRSTQVGEDRNG